jgi:uncharacterized Zn finger protein (UPF0148 family)
LEGLRCPICKAISLVNPIRDGEMFTCPFCNYRFTVTSVRRYFLHPQGRSKEEFNFNNLENLLKEVDYPQLLEVVKMALKEMERRCPEIFKYNFEKKGC